MEQTDRIAASSKINAMIDDATDPNRPHIGIESVGEYLERVSERIKHGALVDLHKQAAFVKELTDLLNVHNIDGDCNMHDDVLAGMLLTYLRSLAMANLAVARRKRT
jgi:hypothetical protein